MILLSESLCFGFLFQRISFVLSSQQLRQNKDSAAHTACHNRNHDTARKRIYSKHCTANSMTKMSIAVSSRPSTAFLPVWPHCANARRNRCQEDLNSCPWRTGGDHQDALILHGQRESSRTWNPIIYLNEAINVAQIVHSEDWSLCLALHTSSGACHKKNKKKQMSTFGLLQEYRNNCILSVWKWVLNFCLSSNTVCRCLSVGNKCWNHLMMYLFQTHSAKWPHESVYIPDALLHLKCWQLHMTVIQLTPTVAIWVQL